MARMTEDGMSASVGQKVKSTIIRCPHCSIELNLPESALGRRLKCPKCELKFVAPAANVPSQNGPASSMFLPAREYGSSGSTELPSFGGGSSGDLELPTSLAPLRETFDLPSLSEGDIPAKSKPPGRANPSSGSGEGDVLALFNDEPKANRKLKGAEARAHARRCSGCSSVVAAGMSLCSRCGLDLDTGKREAPLEIYEDEMPVSRRPATPPIGVLLVGSFCTLGFMLLTMISMIYWARGVQGAQFLMVIWLFGVFGAAQFLRRKSVRPLLLSLSIAAGVGAVFLIALPIYHANSASNIPIDESVPLTVVAEDFDAPQIRSLAESMDMNSITWGVGSLLSYAGLAVYLNSPGLKRQFRG